MRLFKPFLPIYLALSFSNGLLAQSDTIFIDFGAEATTSSEPWNNMTNVDGQIQWLKNSRDLFTPMGLQIYDRFTGINENGTTDPLAILGLPPNATRDSYFGNVSEFAGNIEPTGGLVITGLDTAKLFSFEIFSSRMGVSDNRETKYKFEGSIIDSVYLDPANNTDSKAIIDLKPKPDGSIRIMISPGENNTNSYKFYYLGAIKIIYEQEQALPVQLDITSPAGSEIWPVGSSQTISWTSVNLEDSITVSYSADNGTSWTAIQTVDQTQHSIQWTVPDLLSDQCFISISSGFVSDVSTVAFSIIDPLTPFISLIAPAGGESWIIGSIEKISWTGANLDQDVEIELSLDHKSSWEIIANIQANANSYAFVVPNSVSSDCFVRISSGIVSDESEYGFSIREGVCTNTIVVIGSSTAYGTGANPIDSSWVNRYEDALLAVNGNFEVVNLALGGYTTYQILPTGTPIDPEVSEGIDINRNITKALSFSPYAVIVNMPSNDANKYYSFENQVENFDRIIDTANFYGVRVWIATSQPRNFSDPVQIQIQQNLKDAVLAEYGEYALDFWNGIADSSGKILSQYNSGDGVHLNNDGHRLLFERVMEKQVDTLGCVEPTSIWLPYALGGSINIFPNPFIDNLTIEFETASSGKIEIEIFDYTGRKVGQVDHLIPASGMHHVILTKHQINSSQTLFIAIVRVEDMKGVVQSSFKLIRTGTN